MKLVLSQSSESLLALNHLFTDSYSIFISFLKSSRLELLDILLVSSSNKIGLDFH